jgi:hypothetical protein
MTNKTCPDQKLLHLGRLLVLCGKLREWPIMQLLGMHLCHWVLLR